MRYVPFSEGSDENDVMKRTCCSSSSTESNDHPRSTSYLLRSFGFLHQPTTPTTISTTGTAMFPRTIRRSFVSQRQQLVIRQFQTSPLRSLASKAGQDKDSIDTTSNEYSKSGGDDQAAQESAAFDPSKTSPESESQSAAEESGGVS